MWSHTINKRRIKRIFYAHNNNNTEDEERKKHIQVNREHQNARKITTLAAWKGDAVNLIESPFFPYLSNRIFNLLLRLVYFMQFSWSAYEQMSKFLLFSSSIFLFIFTGMFLQFFCTLYMYTCHTHYFSFLLCFRAWFLSCSLSFCRLYCLCNRFWVVYTQSR